MLSITNSFPKINVLAKSAVQANMQKGRTLVSSFLRIYYNVIEQTPRYCRERKAQIAQRAICKFVQANLMRENE